MPFSNVVFSSLKDNSLGFLMLRSQAQATKFGGWTYSDHELLVSALSELERLREAVNRYSVKLRDYHEKLDACKNVAEEIFVFLRNQKSENGGTKNAIQM